MKKIVRMVFGSHMYGLDTPNSDMDYKGIYLPDLDELLLGTAAKNISFTTGDNTSRNGAEDVDEDWMSLGEFMKLALKGETVALDMLHVNPDLVNVELDPEYGYIWTELVKLRHLFYTKNLKSYMGYVKKQAAKYGLKGSRIANMRESIKVLEQFNVELLLSDVWYGLPENEYAKKIEMQTKTGQTNHFYEVNMKKYQDTNSVGYALERIQTALDSYGNRALLAEKNEGVDWKAVSHALRAGFQLRGILKSGGFSYPLKETEYLAKVKAGELDYKTEVSNVLEAVITEIDELVLVSDLPQTVDVKFWNNWLLFVYMTALAVPDVNKFMEAQDE